MDDFPVARSVLDLKIECRAQMQPENKRELWRVYEERNGILLIEKFLVQIVWLEAIRISKRADSGFASWQHWRRFPSFWFNSCLHSKIV